MVKIRLKRMGTTKRPVYRLVVADSRSPRDGRFIESIGFYDPLPNPAVVSIDADRVQLWLRRGARPSDSARQLLVKEGILAARPFKLTPRPEVAEPAKAAPAAAVAEKPAEAVAAAGEPADAVATAANEPETADEPATAEEAQTTQDNASASATAEAATAEPADEPAENEPSAESVDAAAAATTDEAGGVAGGSADAPKARPGGVPATTGPAAADEAEPAAE